MKLKKILSIILIGGTQMLYSQFTVMINEKPIKQGDEIELEPIQSLSIGFSNPAKIPEYTVGRASLYVNIEDNKGELINQWSYEVNGYTALENFLYLKKSKTYIVWGAGGIAADLTIFDSYKTVQTIYDDAYGNIKYRKLTLSVNLIFEESIGYEKYAKKEILLDKFTFTYNIWNNSNVVKLKSIGASYNYNESSEYEKIYYQKSEAVAGLSDANYYNIRFKNFNAHLHILSLDGTQTEEDALNDIKQHFENYLNYNANICNGKKILKNIPEPDASKDWRELTNLGKDEVLADLDQKNNANFSSVKMLESFSAGTLTGYSFKCIRKSHKCNQTSMLVATIEGPADPKDSKITGATIIYILKHPGNNKKIVIFSFTSDDDKITDITGLSPFTQQMEQFLSNLKFD